MNLRALVNSATSVVNPNITVTVQFSTGQTIGAGLRPVPTYAAPVDGPAQIQALDSKELQHLENLNQQGVLRAIYLNGPLAGIIRPDSKGGDIVDIAAAPGVAANLVGRWFVTKVLESWPDWTKCVITRQMNA